MIWGASGNVEGPHKDITIDCGSTKLLKSTQENPKSCLDILLLENSEYTRRRKIGRVAEHAPDWSKIRENLEYGSNTFENT